MISHSCPGSWTWDFLFYFKNIYIVNVIYINPRSYVSSVLSVGYTHVVNIPKETQNIFITLENFLISSQSIPQSFHSFLKTKKKKTGNHSSDFYHYDYLVYPSTSCRWNHTVSGFFYSKSSNFMLLCISSLFLYIPGSIPLFENATICLFSFLLLDI